MVYVACSVVNLQLNIIRLENYFVLTRQEQRNFEIQTFFHNF